MGMFDWIKIDEEVELPFPANFEEIDFKKLEYQTKSLENCLSTYIVKKNGLYLFENEELKNIDFHGILDFGSYHTTDLVDYSFDFKAKYTDGFLVDLKLCKFQEFFHESKKAKAKILKDKFDYYENMFHRKFLYLIQNALIYSLNLLGGNFKTLCLGFISSKNFGITFFCPKIIFLRFFKNKISDLGFMLENIDTGIKFSSNYYEHCFMFKILGFGLSFKKYKFDLLGELSNI